MWPCACRPAGRRLLGGYRLRFRSVDVSTPRISNQLATRHLCRSQLSAVSARPTGQPCSSHDTVLVSLHPPHPGPSVPQEATPTRYRCHVHFAGLSASHTAAPLFCPCRCRIRCRRFRRRRFCSPGPVTAHRRLMSSSPRPPPPPPPPPHLAPHLLLIIRQLLLAFSIASCCCCYKFTCHALSASHAPPFCLGLGVRRASQAAASAAAAAHLTSANPGVTRLEVPKTGCRLFSLVCETEGL